MKPKYYYHFTNGDKLRTREPLPAIGEWLEHKGELSPCRAGLHASEHPFDALRFAPGNILHLVALGDVIITHGSPVDKVVSNRRKIIATIDAAELLRNFARQCALDVIHLWKAPIIVIQYLNTGDVSLRAAAAAAAAAAARATARDAARAARATAYDAARAAWNAAAAARAAWYAARGAAAYDTAYDTAYDAANARAAAAAAAAAWDAAAWDAAAADAAAIKLCQKQRNSLEQLVTEAFSEYL